MLEAAPHSSPGTFVDEQKPFALAPLYHGGRCTLQYSTKPEAILVAIDDYRSSGIFVVPTHLQRLFAAPDEVREQYRGRHSLRTIISNAAALAPALKCEAVEYFGEGLLHETYGSTEGGIVTNIRADDLLAKQRSVGGPFLGMEIELRREDGTIADIGEPAESFCRGPYSFNGYLNRPDETAQTMIDGWVTVGDLAIRDEDGDITITDRKKDMVVIGGMNVYPREIEMVLEQTDGFRECAVVGEPSTELGEALHAFIETERGADVSTETLMEACRQSLADYEVPKKVTFLVTLPRGATGKLMKRDLRVLATGAEH
ncbi:class I adenylate-forming enzyme family protein [Erythrobacter sp.]|uniref:class I adenylate-forming enzyme family protein n=1 Tax=Erythrobacter sp. TaxID=1042 RepID=UPI002EBCF529|nr:fatty acid--CoA ligase family protein [Erythrobacter sp.]